MRNISKIATEYIKKGRSTLCPIIDMHGHFGPIGGCYMPGHPVEKMLETLKRCGVKRLVFSSHLGLFGDTAKGNELVQNIIDAYPEYFLGYCIINPSQPDSMDKCLKSFHKLRGFVGFKFWPDYHVHPVTGPGYTKALEYADRNELIILIHTWGHSLFDSPQQVAEIAPKYPGATFIMGHAGYGDWEASVKAAYEFPNVFLDLCAVWVAHDWSMQPRGNVAGKALESILSINGVIEYMVEKSGSKKIVFGSDIPWYSQHYGAGAILFSHINDDAIHDIMHRNAERMLKSFLS